MSTPFTGAGEFVQHLHRLWDKARPMTFQEVSYLASVVRFARPWTKGAPKLESFRDVGARLRGAGDLVAESFSHINELFDGSEFLPGTVLTGFRELII